MKIVCLNCGRAYPEDGFPYRCPRCGGLFDIPELHFDPGMVDDGTRGVWRYRHTFAGMRTNFPEVTLGEGGTPLIWSQVLGRQVAFKCEYLNPTGSFKDRGFTLITTFLASRGASYALEDSCGNAGASFAAYAGRAGIRAGVFVPICASGPQYQQIGILGAEVHSVEGSRTNVSEALLSHLAHSGAAYASHAWMPFNLPGYATTAYEIWEQLGCAPGTVICPAGQGGLLLGMYRGFSALYRAGLIHSIPRMIGVQARACPPLWVLSTAGMSAMGFVTEGQTLADGVRVKLPLRGGALLQMVRAGHGDFFAVEEEKILPGRDELAFRGLYVEPTSAIVWAALEANLQYLEDPVVVVLTGSGYKYSK